MRLFPAGPLAILVCLFAVSLARAAVLIRNTNPVPESSATLALVGASLLGLAILGRKLRR
jgi:hypothetical protein